MLIIMSKEEKNLGAFQSIMDILMDWVFKFFLLNKTLDQRFGAKLKNPVLCKILLQIFGTQQNDPVW